MDNRIQTHIGLAFDVVNPEPGLIQIADIAHALANICRFTGHVRQFYSVAQHSVEVSNYVSPEHALWGLLHDASEAYMSDIARPVKKLGDMAGYRKRESALMRAVAMRFGLPMEMPAEVDTIDYAMCVTEALTLMAPLNMDLWSKEELSKALDVPIVPLLPADAEVAFLYRFYELTRR